MNSLGELLARQVLDGALELGSNGAVVDSKGRLVCTMNLRALTLTEALTYAELFRAAIRHCDALRALEAEAGR